MATKTKKKSVSFSTILNATLVVMFIIAVLTIGCSLFLLSIAPETLQTLYVSGALTYAEEDENGDKPYPIEIKLYTNENENGIKCLEVKFNYYTDTTIPTTEDEYKNTYAQGFQMTDGSFFSFRSTLGWWSSTWSTTPVNCYYYNTTNNVSFYAINALTPDDSWIVDYSIKSADGTTQNNLVKLMQKGSVQTGTGALGWVGYTEQNIYMALHNMLLSAGSLNDGEWILQFDMSDYFTFKIYDSETGQFSSDYTDETSVFVNIKVTKSSNGLVYASQSMFGAVEHDTNYSYVGITANEYWESYTVYTLSANDFSFAINDDYLVVATLNEDVYSYISTFKRLYLIVYINLDDFGFDGLAEGAFHGLPINEVIITSSTQRYFAVYDNYNIIADATVEIVNYGGGE